MSGRKVPTTLLVLAALLAGCAGEEAAPDAPAAEPAGAPAQAALEAIPDPGAAPHVHDLWDGRARITLLEADFRVEPLDAALWAGMATLYMGEPAAGGFFVELPEGALVPEGTGQLEVLATWSDPAVTGLRFLYRHAGSGDIQGWVPAPKGEPALVEVAPDMSDMPHAQRTRWAFLFAADGTPPLAVGTIHLRIDVVRTRDPALYPGHPDPWGNATELLRLDAEAAARTSATPRVLFSPGDGFSPPPGAVAVEKPIPMETATLLVQVHVLSVTPSTRPLESLRLLVRTAQDLQFDFDETDAKPETSPDGLSWTWRLRVKMEQTDSPYAETSAWALLVDPEYGSPAPAPLPLPCDCHDAEVRYRVAVTALKDARESAPVSA